LIPWKTPKDFEFFENSHPPIQADMLVQGLARDVERYLHDEPVEARPPSALYRFRKLAWRHRVALTTVALVGLSMVLGSAVSIWQALRATQAEADALEMERQARTAAAETGEQYNRARDNEQKARDNEHDAQKERNAALAAREEIRRLLYCARMNDAYHNWRETVPWRVTELLDQLRPKASETDLRGWEWHFLNRINNPEMMALDALPEADLVYSADGKRLIESSRRGRVVFDADTGKELQRTTANGSDPKSWITADGTSIVVVRSQPAKTPGDPAARDIRILDLATEKERFHFQIADETAPQRAVSADGKLWLVGQDIYEADRGKKRVSLDGLAKTTSAAAFSADGRALVTGSGKVSAGPVQDRTGDITVWDATTGKALHTLKDTGNAMSLTYHPDGRRIAVITFGPEGGMHTKVWDTKTGKVSDDFNGYGTQALFSPDGRWLATIMNHDAILWEVRTGKLFNNFSFGHHASGLAFSRDGRRLAAGMRFFNSVMVWDIAALIEAGEPLAKGRLQERGVAFSPDGKHVACTSGCGTTPGWVGLHEASTGRQEWQVKLAGFDAPFEVVFHPDGDRLAVAVTTNPHNVGSQRGRVVILSVKTGEKLREYATSADDTKSIAFSPDGHLLATASEDMTVRLWDTATGQERRVIDGHHGFVFSVAFSPDGTKVLSGGYDSRTDNHHQVAILWDAATGKELWRVEDKIGYSFRSLAFTRDGKRIATPNTVRDAATGEVLFEMKPNFTLRGSIAFSPDGRRVATDGAVTLFDVATGQVVARLKDKDDSGADNVAFSPDGWRLAVVNDDGTLQIYDATPLRPK
jgi:eukaryotic-like serine/threonine-protein kinase